MFGNNGRCRDRVRFVKNSSREVFEAHHIWRGQKQLGARIERLISLIPPGKEWLKLNTDGASKGNPGLAAAGG